MDKLVKIISTGSDSIALEGELTFFTVMSLFSESQKWFYHHSSSTQIDFKSVTRVDSSVLPLLIEWKRLAKKQGGSVCFVNLPEAVLRLASLSQMASMLLDSKKE